MRLTVDIDIDQRIIDAKLFRQVEDALAVAAGYITDELRKGHELGNHVGKGEIKDLGGNVLGTWTTRLTADTSEGRMFVQGAEGQAREFVITSPFTASGRYMEFTARAADADVDYRMLIERVS